MARIKNGILGGFSGKVGTVVGWQSGENYYIRALPRGPKKFTAAELVNQHKFKLVNDFLSPFRSLLKVGFKDFYTKTGGLRAAVSYTLKNALKQNNGAWEIDPALLKISGGNLPQASAPMAQLVGENHLLITWENEGRSNWHDQLILLVHASETSTALSLIYDGPLRKEKRLELEVPSQMRNTSIHIYIGFIAADRSSQSNSQYLGSFEIS